MLYQQFVNIDPTLLFSLENKDYMDSILKVDFTKQM